MSTHSVAVLRCLALLCCLQAIIACTPLKATGAAISGDRRTTGTVVDDQQIERAAKRFFAADAALARSCRIDVTSYNQQVLLTGACPTEELRAKAAEYVGRVAKVRHIFNEIELNAPSTLGARTSDGLLATRVRTRLLTISNLPTSNMKVVTDSGVVYLMGLVDEQSGNIAAEAASGVGGVVKVVKLFEHP